MYCKALVKALFLWLIKSIFVHYVHATTVLSVILLVTFYAGKIAFANAVAPAFANVSTHAFAPLIAMSFNGVDEEPLDCAICVSDFLPPRLSAASALFYTFS